MASLPRPGGGRFLRVPQRPSELERRTGCGPNSTACAVLVLHREYSNPNPNPNLNPNPNPNPNPNQAHALEAANVARRAGARASVTSLAAEVP